MERWAPAETVSDASSGDQSAVERLVEAIWPRCYRLAATVVHDRGLAEDAAQESCAIVHAKIRGLRDPSAFDTWVYRIVMREAARARRRQHERYEPEQPPRYADDGSTQIDVWRALDRLSPDQRDVVVLFYFDDLKTEEIAHVLSVAHATVRTRLARARERLRGVLDDYGNEPAAFKEGNVHVL